MRFKDIPVGSVVRFNLGGSMASGQKISEGLVRVQKLNSPGTVDIKINPELNQDDWEVRACT